MKVRFVVLEPESKRGSYEVLLPIVIGRGSEAKFRIQQDRISRKHCELFDRDGDVYVRDLGSTNGTFLEGEQIAASIRTAVPPGSVLRVGTIEIRIDYKGSGRIEPTDHAKAEDATIGIPASTIEEPVAHADQIVEHIEHVEDIEHVEHSPHVEHSSHVEHSEQAEHSEHAAEAAAAPAWEPVEEDSEPPPVEAPPMEMEAAPVEAPSVQAIAQPKAALDPGAITDPAATVDATAFLETQKSPEPGDFGELEGLPQEDPKIEAFTATDFGDPPPPADGSFDFLEGSSEQRQADDEQLGEFFKGLQ